MKTRPFMPERYLSVGLLTLFALGCGDGPTTYPVEGQVVFADGTKLSGGTIEFDPVAGDKANQASPRGRVESDGTFRVVTPPNSDGAVAGTYRVLVRGLLPTKEYEPGEARPPMEAEIDPRFGNYETSGLKVTVEPKPNQFTISVERVRRPH